MKMGNLWTTIVQFVVSKKVHPEKSHLQDDLSEPSDLSAEDGLIFKALCQFIWIQGDLLPLIFDVENEIYTKQGITRSTLKRLEEIGLIVFENNGFIKKGYGKHTRLFYDGKPTKIGFQRDAGNYLDLGHVLLTERGKKLALNYKAPGNRKFYEYVVTRWFQQGLVLSSIQVDRNRNKSSLNYTCSIKE